MDEDILNKTVIYINTSNATFYNNSSYDFYYDIVDPIKNAVYMKILKSEIILNPSGSINGKVIEDCDPVYIQIKNFNRVSTNINGNNFKCTDYILLNISDKFGTVVPNANVSFKTEYTSTSCHITDTNMIIINPIEPNLKRFNIQLYDKNNIIIPKSAITKFSMIVCLYSNRKKITQF